MFRFINTGLKHSVTFPSSVYHSPINQRLWESEDNENDAHRTLVDINNKITPVYPRSPTRQILTLSYLWNVRWKDFEHEINSLLSLSKVARYCNKGNTESLVDSGRSIFNKITECVENCKSNESIESSLEKNRENKEKIYTKDDSHSNLQTFEHEMNEKGCIAANMCDWVSALRYWSCASSMNYPPAQFNLGVYYESNNDLIKAEKWYRAAVDNGDHSVAAYNLAILLNNKNKSHLRSEIVALLHKSAKQGLIEAQKCIDLIDLESK